jgi:hypothetical protein
MVLEIRYLSLLEDIQTIWSWCLYEYCYYQIYSYSLDFIFYQCIYGCILVQNCNSCTLLLCIYILIVCLCIFIVPDDALQLPWLRFFRAFSAVVRKMPGYNSQRRGTARTLPKIFGLFYVLFVLRRSVYCLCVNVYCTTATGWQHNCSLTSTSYHIWAVVLLTYW